MNIRHTFYLGLVIVLIAVSSVGAYKWGERSSIVASDILVPPVQPPVVQPLPAVMPPAVEQVYENEYMQVIVPAGWNLSEVTETLSDATTGAVSITRNGYTLYIHPQASQASGVTGGRFAEIAMGAPSADAVVTEQPNPPCGQTVNGGIISIPGVDLTRKDLYVSKADKKDYCAVPTTGTAWYFSYITDYKGGYINYYKAGELPGYVITMAYNSKDVSALPLKGSPELTTALTEMTGIIKTLKLKGWDKITR